MNSSYVKISGSIARAPHSLTWALVGALGCGDDGLAGASEGGSDATSAATTGESSGGVSAGSATTESTTIDEEIECVSADDCVNAVPECRSVLACEDGTCIYDDTPAGQPLRDQAEGDCAVVVCDGRGGSMIAPAPEDVEDDGILCTLDLCEGMIPQHTPGLSACYSGPAKTAGIGICAAGVQMCDADGVPTGPCMGEVLPEVESCDVALLDEDCDGEVNEAGESCVCTPGAEESCYSGPEGTAGLGACKAGSHVCAGDGRSFGPCVGEVIPMAEVCEPDHHDEDCDGAVNEEGAACSCGDGDLSLGETCDDGDLDDLNACSNACEPNMVVDVAVGSGGISCAILSDQRLKCWGANGVGQLGVGDTIQRGDQPGEMGGNLPAVDLGKGAIPVQVGLGGAFVCARLADGTIKCWGRNSVGQLGLGDMIDRGAAPTDMGDSLPRVDLGAAKKAVQIAVGDEFACALLDDGRIKCWGRNESGQLGLGDSLPRGTQPGEMGDALPPVDLGVGKVAVAIAAGGSTACARLSDDTLKCWGANNYGQLGLGDKEHRGDQAAELGDALPTVDLGAGQVAQAISVGGWHTCAILNEGAVKCWGRNASGELGIGTKIYHGDGPGEMGDDLPFIALGADASAVALSASLSSTCALLANNTLKCWGVGYLLGLGIDEGEGSIGDAPGEMGDALPAVELSSGSTPPVGLSAGARGFHRCARLSDGSLKCWGDNGGGRLGLGDLDDRGDDPLEMGEALPIVLLWSSVW